MNSAPPSATRVVHPENFVSFFHAARFAAAVRPIDLVLWAVALLAATWFVPIVLAVLPLILAWGWHIRRTLGGISGDGHGAGIELIETGLLMGAVIAAHCA